MAQWKVSMTAAPRPMNAARRHDGAEDPVEEHPVLVAEGHREGREDEREDEDVVDRQAELEHVAGEVGRAILRATQAQHEQSEPQADRDIDGAAHGGRPKGHGVRPTLEDDEVDGEDRAEGDHEGDPEERAGVHG